MNLENRKLSGEAQAVWDQISEETQYAIHKHNPFKYRRDQEILELKAKGVRAGILAELTGLNRGTIFRIAKREALIPEKQRQEVRSLVETFTDLLRGIGRILNDKSGREDHESHRKSGKDHSQADQTSLDPGPTDRNGRGSASRDAA